MSFKTFVLELEQMYGAEELLDILNITSADLLVRFNDKAAQYYAECNEASSDQEIERQFDLLYNER